MRECPAMAVRPLPEAFRQTPAQSLGLIAKRLLWAFLSVFARPVDGIGGFMGKVLSWCTAFANRGPKCIPRRLRETPLKAVCRLLEPYLVWKLRREGRL